MFGRSPMTTNSVMPMPKDPMARERSVHVAAPLEGVEEVTLMNGEEAVYGPMPLNA